MTTHAPLPNFGCQQSPIDFATAKIFKTEDLGIEVTWTTLTVKALKARKYAVADADGVLIMDGEKYVPVDFHWHFPAEHASGTRHPAEVHVVHVHEADVPMAAKGQLDWLRIAVIGVYIAEGDSAYKPFQLEAGLLDGMADGKTAQITRADAFPDTSGAYRYEGGLTTPPYSENVTFFIHKDPASALPEQLDDHGQPNSRPLQSVNRRVVVEGSIG